MGEAAREARCIFNTQQYDLASQARLLRLLRTQWGIEATLNRDKTYYRIRISVGGMRRFAELVGPYLLPELRYKLPQVTP